MLFNSHVFLFAFLPIAVAGYFAFLHLGRAGAAKLWLAAASLFFYAWWNVLYLPLLLGSIFFNFAQQVRQVDIGQRRDEINPRALQSRDNRLGCVC